MKEGAASFRTAWMIWRDEVVDGRRSRALRHIWAGVILGAKMLLAPCAVLAGSNQVRLLIKPNWFITRRHVDLVRLGTRTPRILSEEHSKSESIVRKSVPEFM